MWRSRTRLTMWVPGVFTVGRHPAPGEERREAAVLVTFRAPQPARAPDFSTLEDAVRTFPCRPADVTLRYGMLRAPDRMLTL